MINQLMFYFEIALAVIFSLLLIPSILTGATVMTLILTSLLLCSLVNIGVYLYRRKDIEAADL